MILLIDYDNVDEQARRLGVEHVARKTFALSDQHSSPIKRGRIRLYGGWYEGGRLTRQAQELGAEIRKCSPVRIARNPSGDIVLVDVELAVSILATPKATITNTLRKKGYPRRLHCEVQPWTTCANATSCPIGAAENFLKDEICPNLHCATRPQDIFYKMEQKVVDTMMVADLIFSAQSGEPCISVVSRDDDIWPGLSIAASHTSTLMHISTVAASRVPPYYSSLPTPPYQRIQWT